MNSILCVLVCLVVSFASGLIGCFIGMCAIQGPIEKQLEQRLRTILSDYRVLKFLDSFERSNNEEPSEKI